MNKLRYVLRSPRTPARIARGVTWLADAVHRAVTYAAVLSAGSTAVIFLTVALIERQAGL